MKKVSFDEIKNIEFPESWKENALSIPLQEQKKPLFLLHYRYAVGLAVCIALAVAVTLALSLGLGRDIDLTVPDINENLQTDYSAADSNPNSTAYTTVPNGDAAIKSDNNNQTATSVTEFAASGSADKSNPLIQKHKLTPQSKVSANSQTAENNKNNNCVNDNKASDKQNISVNTRTVTEPNTESQTESQKPESDIGQENEILIPVPQELNPAAGGGEQENTDIIPGKKYTFITDIEPRYAVGNLFCLIEKENGEALGEGGLYSKNRKASILYSENGKAVSIEFECYCNFIIGKAYTVNFYNSHGELLKKGTATIDNSDCYKLY